MQVEVLRKGSQGLAGTLANANHHARDLVKLINKIVKELGDKTCAIDNNFSKWRQGHNLSVFETKDGRKFVIRPLHLKGDGYVGLTIAMRLSRSHEEHLTTIYHDYRNGITESLFTTMLRCFSEPTPKNLPSSEDQ